MSLFQSSLNIGSDPFLYNLMGIKIHMCKLKSNILILYAVCMWKGERERDVMEKERVRERTTVSL